MGADRAFAARLRQIFNDDSMAVVARRLGIPHATVRNYYQGRLPAPEVLIKIAIETGVSLNWLLIGSGEMYAGEAKGIDIGKLLEAKIEEIVRNKLHPPIAPKASRPVEFDVGAAVEKYKDPVRIMNAWFRHEGREYPQDYGIAFFRGWETFSSQDKIDAVRDAKRVLDKVLGTTEGKK